MIIIITTTLSSATFFTAGLAFTCDKYRSHSHYGKFNEKRLGVLFFFSLSLSICRKERAPAGTFVACIVVMWRINCGFVSALIKEQYHFLGCIALASATKVPACKYFLGARVLFCNLQPTFLPLCLSCCLRPVCNVLIKTLDAFCWIALSRSWTAATAARPKNALETPVKRLLFLYSHSWVRRLKEWRVPHNGNSARVAASFYGATKFAFRSHERKGVGYQVMQPA